MAIIAIGAMLIAPGALSADGVVAAGRMGYARHCGKCHGLRLEGAAGPALRGTGFASRWSSDSSGLYEAISATMPLDAPGSLNPRESRAIADYILTSNGLNTGRMTKTRPRLGAASNVESPSHWPKPPRLFSTASSRHPTNTELLQPPAGDWPLYNRDFEGRRYSPLMQIAPANATRLAPQCIFQTGEVGSFEASPVAWHGTLYLTTADATYAVNAATCRLLWKYQYRPRGPQPLPVNRGVALYEGMVIRGTPDGHLIAIDAKTGRLLWDDAVIDSRSGGVISAAPVAFDGKIFVGVGIGDFGVTGRVYAFDARSARELWSFDVVPRGRGRDAQSWGSDPSPAGGAVWSTVTFDPATRGLYVPTGNPAPDFDDSVRPGDNLYTDSVVVLDADSGRVQWYVQQVPHDVHDWDTAAAPMLYQADGHELMAVGSKNAYLYLYSLATGELLARVDLARRRVNDSQSLSRKDPLHVCPGIVGGVQWNGPAYDPREELIFINSVDWCGTLKAEPAGVTEVGGGTYRFDPPRAARGSLHAVDAVTGAVRWTYRAEGPMLGGIATTASGLVFTGSSNGDFLVFESRTGRMLYSFYTGGAVAGGVSTYLADGKQYVAVLSGNSSKGNWQKGGAATLVIFGLQR